MCLGKNNAMIHDESPRTCFIHVLLCTNDTQMHFYRASKAFTVGDQRTTHTHTHPWILCAPILYKTELSLLTPKPSIPPPPLSLPKSNESVKFDPALFIILVVAFVWVEYLQTQIHMSTVEITLQSRSFHLLFANAYDQQNIQLIFVVFAHIY